MSSARERSQREPGHDYESLLGLLSLAPVGLARLDSAGRFEFANPEMSRLWQAAAPRGDLGDFFDFLGLAAPELRARALAAPACGALVFKDARIVISGARVEVLSCTLTRTPDGAYFVVLSDATERREREEARLRGAAEEASRARHHFLSAMDGRLPEAELTAAQTIRRSAPELLHRLDTLLDMLRIGSGQLDLKDEAFALKPLVGEAVERIRGAAEAKGLVVSQEFDRIGAGAFRGDPARLRQILEIFLSNALARTPAGEVKVKVRGMPEPGAGWRLRLDVREGGVGIAEDARRRLCPPFAQADRAPSRDCRGADLRLGLARGLAELMGGDCGVAERPGGGSIFWVDVVLPVAAAETTPPAAHAVLVVDDGKVNAEVVRLVLSAAGYEVQVASDGFAAVEAARARDFALILMDIHMPRMDGFAATRAIRALPGAAARVPVIGMSANALAETQAQGREAGMNDYVLKPLAPAKLRALASRWTHSEVA